MTAFLVRSQIKQRIVDLLTSAADVEVFRAWPPTPPDELIYLAAMTCGLEYAVLGTNLPRDDKFTVVIMVMVNKPGNEIAEAEDRAEQIASTVITTLADEPRLDDDENDDFSLFDALVTTVDGPDSMPGPNGEGWDAFVRVSVDIHLRITREL